MIYFDNAATSYPKPKEVYSAVEKCIKEYCGNPGRSGHKMSLESGRVILEAREMIANLFNIYNSDRVIFTLNATDSINIALKGLLKKGDHVITTSMEHNSMIRPLKGLENNGIETTIIKCNNKGEININDIEKEIRSNTVLICTIHASNVIGSLLPIRSIGELAKNNNIIYMVDAAQTAGLYNIDVVAMNIDILAFTGHKGMYGPQGVGGLYISDKVDLKVFREGGTGSKSELLVQPNIYPDKFESGTPNTPGIAGLCAGLKFINNNGIDNIRKHEEMLGEYFLEELKKVDKIKIYGPLDMKKQVPVFSINIGDIGSSEISYLLDDSFNIATRSGLHCSPLAHNTIGTFKQGTVRFSFGYFNTKDEIDVTVEALKKISKEV